MTRQMAVVLMVLICGAILAADRTETPVKPFQLDVTVVDESQTPTIKERVVALAADEGTIHTHDGGELPSSPDGSSIPFGTRLDASIKKDRHGRQRIDMTFEYSNKYIAGEKTTQVVFANVLRLRTDLIVGESKRINCGKQRYCTIRLD
ncbi:hypothetical protein [Schlesneria paludicola]|uniref:hypothetical protein n=1 Tax=Schlesneria paludicola TaxID=360056 RepID=UPI0012F87976|nr:hypothetical protein [Schlesneria paludicola]